MIMIILGAHKPDGSITESLDYFWIYDLDLF
jgi:hypothetical protein